MVTIVDDFSKYSWTYMIVNKLQVFTVVKHFIFMVENQFENTVKKIRTDNGNEFVNNACDSFLSSKGIIH